MKITKIEKKKRLYLLQIDQTENLYVTEDTIVRFMLRKDLMLSEEELTEIKQFAQFSEAKNLALYYLSFKQRTKKEVSGYLKEKEFDSNIITGVIQQLVNEKWIDEERYVETYIRQNLATSDKGPFVITQKLKDKGIPEDIITRQLQTTDFQDLIEKLIGKYIKKYQSKIPQKQLFPKIQQAMATKGFHYNEVKEALSQVQLVDNSEQETKLLEKEIEKALRRYQKKYTGYELKQRLTQALARKGFDYDEIKRSLSNYL